MKRMWNYNTSSRSGVIHSLAHFAKNFIMSRFGLHVIWAFDRKHILMLIKKPYKGGADKVFSHISQRRLISVY
ncbi:hypothetical protein NBG4_60019 [Candidatus Sulfobium mesophilum]|uniref:Uncharacterized protein n=1 Tax=Candidatus Sulfobium mesophilum TaxID=2016548 RepID=A0A2U3QJF5_9BACT|nr:hypothetical protein NBG4_60019 [Candidatus Sulfobium mesophilum]